MTDNSWELVGLLACALILLVWALHALVHGYLARHRARMRLKRHGWDAAQDLRHRIAKRGACERAGLRP